MKALSIWQPWASLLAVGTKRYETRSWKPPTSAIGEIIALHASLRWTSEQRDFAAWFRDLELNVGFAESPPLGVILGAARLVACHRTSDVEIDATEFDLGDFSVGRYAWEFEAPAMFSTSIACTGHRGLWALDDEIARAVREQIDKGAA